MRQLTLALLLSSALAGCGESRVVWRGDATLGDTVIILPSAASFRAIGQLRQICVIPEIDTMIRRHPVQLNVYLIRQDGSRDSLGWKPDTSRWLDEPVLIVTPDTAGWTSRKERLAIIPPAPPRMRDMGRSWCALDWSGPHYFRSYRAVGIRSASALRISEVRWETGWPSL